MKHLFGMIILLLTGTAAAAELHVAVAANFVGPLRQLAAVYERASGHKLLLSPAATGQLYAQIKQGAPFDVFLSADRERPKQLEAEGLAVAGSRFTYATGKLVLWSPKADALGSDGAAFLKGGNYRYIAIANPKTAPYGLAAQQALHKLQLWDSLNEQKKLVTGESIAQTMQFAATGNADAAFVAVSQVIKPDGSLDGSSWLPPADMYEPIDQDAVLLTRSTEQAPARDFLRWLKSDAEALKIIRAAGYTVQP
jgi:molybdate transport system substrate-binding protein